MRSLSALCSVLGVLACAPSVQHADAPAWRAEPSMTLTRAAHAVVSTGDALYALGGTGAGGKPVLAVERFDGHAWSVVSTIPGEGLNAPAAAGIGGSIYLIGGFGTTTNVPLATVQRFDVATRSWSTVAPLPAPRGGHSAVVLDGKIHVIGGGNSRSTIADHSVYDPATNAWTNAASLPRTEGSPAAVAFNGKVYSIGGRSGLSDFGFVDVYDPASDTWTTGPAIDPPRGTAGAVAYCSTIFVFGGESQSKKASIGEVLRLDAGGASWSRAAPMITPRNFARSVLLNDRVFVVGGSPVPGMSHSSEGSATVESFGPRC